MKNNHSLILINERAQQGEAIQKWDAISGSLTHLLPSNAEVVLSDSASDAAELVRDRCNSGYRTFIAAGGDGTVNLILNAIMGLEQLNPESVLIGGIGLGSSNDFHKPIRHEINGVPVRLDAHSAEVRDIGQLLIDTGLPSYRKRFFVCNASIGVTAEANHLFNHPARLLKWLKQVHTGSAIVYAAVKTIISFRTTEVVLNLGSQSERVLLSNLAIAKSPHISGNMRYSLTSDTAGGDFAVHLCEAMSKLNLIRTLSDLSHGIFGNRKGQRSLLSSEITVSGDQDMAIEFDGEVESGQTFQFSIAPVKLSFMT